MGGAVWVVGRGCPGGGGLLWLGFWRLLDLLVVSGFPRLEYFFFVVIFCFFNSVTALVYRAIPPHFRGFLLSVF